MTKDDVMLQHYIDTINQDCFDEYDILDFLIFIRERINKASYQAIYDFCDLMAHRNRDDGRAMQSIRAAIDNKYATSRKTGHVLGYEGIPSHMWEREWNQLAAEYHFTITPERLNDISLCIISLSQGTKYDDANGHHGEMAIFQNKGGFLSLSTSEGRPDSYHICYFKAGPYKFLVEFEAGYITVPVETIREDGKLRLKTPTEYII